ncbi:MAG: PLP-dependent lyase/thiolase [Conexivisphaerales archaeon]
MDELLPAVGQTRLVKLERLGRSLGFNVYAKLELQNPTHSHKDRESKAVIEDMLKIRKTEAAIASTGNAAISLAAIGRSLGLKIHVFCSSHISEERKELLNLLKAELHLVEGDYDDAIRKSKVFAEQNGLYLANPGNPAKSSGDMEIGREVAQGMEAQGEFAIAVPTNNGTLLHGIWQGVKKANDVKLVAAVAKETKIADSIAGFHRQEGNRLEEVLRESRCEVVNVSDEEIKDALRMLESEGIYCEPASAASLASILKLNRFPKSVVLIITGSAFKFAKKDLGNIF